MTHLSSYAHDRGETAPAKSCREFSLTFQPRPDESLVDFFRRLEVALKESEATILKLMVYGPVELAAPATEAMRRVFGEVNWPVTWVEGLPCSNAPLAGVQAFAFSGGQVHRLTLGGRVVGSVFEDGDARFCLLGGLGPTEVAGSRVEQTERALNQLQEALAQVNFTLGDVMRTWFYLDDLLSWYDGFNQVRASVYSQTKFRSGAFPASTGVAGRNPAGAALTAGAWAMQPLKARVGSLSPSSASVQLDEEQGVKEGFGQMVREVVSPLQCPACAYGSRFSRAVEVQSGGIRRLLVSGTASIDPNGGTAHVGDVRSQIELSMRVVEAILESRRMSFADVARATAYFKSPADAPAFAEWCDQRELRKLPVVSTGCDICRPDLLFEVEVDAVQPTVN